MSGIVGDNAARASGVIASAGGGKILQVVQALKTGASTISTSWTDISDLSVAITPSDASSKLFITSSVNMMGGRAAWIKLLRDVGGAGYADSAYIGDVGGSRTQCAIMNGVSDDFDGICANIEYLDTTNTTSEVTYKLQGKSKHVTYYLGINRAYADSNSSDYGRGASSITVWEIGA